MVTRTFHLIGDKIIWQGENLAAFRKRGSMVIQSVRRNKSSVGFVGSDRVLEDGYEGFSETLESVVNDKGQPLRFGLIASNALRARAKLRNNDTLRTLTSYPVVATTLLGNIEVEYVPGGVEAELRDRWEEFDAGFELIQSGESVRINGVEIIEDDILAVSLEMIRTPYGC